MLPGLSILSRPLRTDCDRRRAYYNYLLYSWGIVERNLQFLGAGAYGTVSRIIHPPQEYLGKKLVVKQITFIKKDLNKLKKSEIENLRNLKYNGCHYVPQYVYHGLCLPCSCPEKPSHYQGQMFIVMTEVHGYALNKFLSLSFNFIQIHHIAYGIAVAQASINSSNLSHCDLKPSNIMIGKEFQVTLIDIGGTRSINNRSNIFANVCTPGYRPPEPANGHDCSVQEGEVFSYGSVLCELLTDEILFTPNLILQRLDSQSPHYWEPLVKAKLTNRQDFPESEKTLMLNLLKKVIAPSPFRYKSPKEVLFDPFFTITVFIDIDRLIDDKVTLIFFDPLDQQYQRCVLPEKTHMSKKFSIDFFRIPVVPPRYRIEELVIRTTPGSSHIEEQIVRKEEFFFKTGDCLLVRDDKISLTSQSLFDEFKDSKDYREN